MLTASKSKKILLSVGPQKAKEKLLLSILKLSKLNIKIYATRSTSRHLKKNGIKNTPVFKIAQKKSPNIATLLAENKLDFVLNILSGKTDHDESSDSKQIRYLSIENSIPLITDVDVAIMVIERMCAQAQTGSLNKITNPSEPWNMKVEFLEMVRQKKGFACYHAHLDKAYLISRDTLKLSQTDMQKKWELFRYLKQAYTFDDLVMRMSRGVEAAISGGCTHYRTFVDADATVCMLPIEAAVHVKALYKDRINLQIGVQPFEGVLNKASRKYFTKACEKADVVGGLPSKDRPLPEKHLDYILDLARDLGKPCDVHVDQENNPYESETLLLALKTIEHRMQGQVCGIHGISVASKPVFEQDKILSVVKEADMGLIICPSAAISMKQINISAPLHNSIAPLTRLLDQKIRVFLGVDNIYDLFQPLSDGDIWHECRVLMDSCRYYDIDVVSSIACEKSGFS